VVQTNEPLPMYIATRHRYERIEAAVAGLGDDQGDRIRSVRHAAPRLLPTPEPHKESDQQPRPSQRLRCLEVGALSYGGRAPYE